MAPLHAVVRERLAEAAEFTECSEAGPWYAVVGPDACSMCILSAPPPPAADPRRTAPCL